MASGAAAVAVSGVVSTSGGRGMVVSMVKQARVVSVFMFVCMLSASVPIACTLGQKSILCFDPDSRFLSKGASVHLHSALHPGTKDGACIQPIIKFE